MELPNVQISIPKRRYAVFLHVRRATSKSHRKSFTLSKAFFATSSCLSSSTTSLLPASIYLSSSLLHTGSR